MRAPSHSRYTANPVRVMRLSGWTGAATASRRSPRWTQRSPAGTTTIHSEARATGPVPSRRSRTNRDRAGRVPYAGRRRGRRSARRRDRLSIAPGRPPRRRPARRPLRRRDNHRHSRPRPHRRDGEETRGSSRLADGHDGTELARVRVRRADDLLTGHSDVGQSSLIAAMRMPGQDATARTCRRSQTDPCLDHHTIVVATDLIDHNASQVRQQNFTIPPR
jgi:hypothetical protein